MATWKKTNEAYFGDTFNRDATLCYATEDGSSYDAAIKATNWKDNNITFTCANATTDGVAFKALCDNIASTADGISYAIGEKASTNQIESLSDKIRDIQAQINDLKKNLETKKENSELRSALKTLHYKREIE